MELANKNTGGHGHKIRVSRQYHEFCMKNVWNSWENAADYPYISRYQVLGPWHPFFLFFESVQDTDINDISTKNERVAIEHSRTSMMNRLTKENKTIRSWTHRDSTQPGILDQSTVQSTDDSVACSRGFAAPNTGDRLCGITVCLWAYWFVLLYETSHH